MKRDTLPALIVATIFAVGCEGANPSSSGAQARTLPTTTRTAAPAPAKPIDASRRTAITTAVERVAPAVVTV